MPEMLENIPDMSQYENSESVMLSQLDIFQQQQIQTIASTTSNAPPPPSQVNIMGVYTLQEEPEETEENAMWIQLHLILINFSILVERTFRIVISPFNMALFRAPTVYVSCTWRALNIHSSRLSRKTKDSTETANITVRLQSMHVRFHETVHWVDTRRLSMLV